MSAIRHKAAVGNLRRSAPVFAAMGDPTRLELLTMLGGGARMSIRHLAGGTTITRQAVTKHLRRLQKAGLVRGVKRGRETLFELRAETLDEVRRALDEVSRQWGEALARLKAFVEE